MGGERASTSRQRLSGKTCCNCKSSISEPAEKPGERYCKRCAPKRKIYMHFMLSNDWFCQFLEEDLRTSLPKKLRLKTPDDIRGMIERVGSVMNTEQRQAFEYAINTGRGSAWLTLTDEEYRKLKRG